MSENQELFIHPDEEGSVKGLLAKWLYILFWSQIAAAVLSGLATFQILGTVTQLISLALGACFVFVMFQLSGVNEHYRKAFIFGAIQYGATAIGLFIEIGILSLVVSICSIVSLYQQYKGHSEVTEAKDSRLSHKWNSLFIWQLAVGLLSGVVSVAGVLIGVSAGADAAVIISAILLGVGAVSVAIQIVYLVYLKKTLTLFQGE